MKYFCLLLLVIQSSSFIAQDIPVRKSKTPFSERKNFLGVSANVWSPVIGNEYEPNFNILKGNQLVRGKDYLDWGLRMDYCRRISRRFSIGLEAGVDLFSVHRNSKLVLGPAEYSYRYDYESVDVFSGIVMPKVRFSVKPRWFPLEIVHELGVGLRYSDQISKTYHVTTSKKSNPYPGDEPAYGVAVPLVYDDKLIFVKGENLVISGMYSLTLRTPLTSFLCLHYGVRVTYNHMLEKPVYNDYLYEPYHDNLSTRAFCYYLDRRLKNTFFQANVGLTFAF